MTYQELIDKLKSSEPFSFSRFGDGEFACMLGKKGANCDGHEYYPDLGKALNKAWDEPRGIIGTQRYGQAIYPQFTHTGIDADILHKASIGEELGEFCMNLRHTDLIIVGPKHIEGLMVWREFIEVPERNAWLQHDQILEQLRNMIQKWDVVLYCCGMMAEVLIWELYDKKIIQIDCGSVFDPYCGVKSRNYHHKLKL